MLLHTVRSKEMWEGAHPPKYDLKETANAVSFYVPKYKMEILDRYRGGLYN